MADNNPSLFVYLPLNEIRHSDVLDASPNRRHGSAHGARIVADETFGACLELAPGSYVKFHPWRLDAALLLHRAILPPRSLRKLTFTLWLSLSASQWKGTLLDVGLGKGLQRFTVGLHGPMFFAVQLRDKIRGTRWTGKPIAEQGPWAHFAMVWDPKPGPASPGCRMFLNGTPLVVAMNQDKPEPVSGMGVYETFLGSPAFSGKLAHLRIYTRELTHDEIAQEISLDLARQRKAPLIECSLLDPVERPMLMLPSAGASVGEKMTVAAKPLRSGIRLANLEPGPPSPDNCHFEIRFRPGVLNLSRTVEKVSVTGASGSWAAKTIPHIGYVSVCIRCNSEEPLAENVQLKMKLDSLMADERFGRRWTRIDLLYHHLIDDRGIHTGRIPQWLQLAPREAVQAPVLTPVHGWTHDPGPTITVNLGNTFLHGRLVCANAQDMMKRNLWGPEWGLATWQHFPFREVAFLPVGYRPWPRENLRYAGRVRWLSAHSPEPLWQSDLCIFSFGMLGIDAEKLTAGVYYSIARIEVSLDGVSYASDESLMKEGET